MTDRSATPAGPHDEADIPAVIDPHVAHVARTYDYILGGKDNFAVDREAAERLSEVFPGGLETARRDVRAQRSFLERAVRYLIEEAGVHQFLDIGTGIPNADNVNGVAQQLAPASRIVYVDNDPMVLAHAHTLLKSTPEGATAFIEGDLRQPEAVLERARQTLDFNEPIGLMLVGILHVTADADDPYAIVARLAAALPSNSYLAISHLPKDIAPEAMAEMEKRSHQMMRQPFVMRTHAQVVRFFDGLELLDPGVVPVDDWHPDPGVPDSTGVWEKTPLYGGVGRKP